MIEIAPIGFMRGRTFSNCFVIFDEAQNGTIPQIKMFLTRFGNNVKCIIQGDLGQSDLNGSSGLKWPIKKLEECSVVAHINASNNKGEILRSVLVGEILKYIE